MSLRALILLLLFTFDVHTMMAQDKGKRSDSDCSIGIGFPANDARVGADGNVRGNAKGMPRGTHLWVMAHRRGLALWWPQAGGEVTVSDDGEWAALVTYGENRDQGNQFEAVAIVVDEPTDSLLKKWISQAEATGQYPGISLPRASESCNMPRVTVTRN
jgi:hypothetical protein